MKLLIMQCSPACRYNALPYLRQIPQHN